MYATLGVKGGADDAIEKLIKGELIYQEEANCSHHDNSHGCHEHSCHNEGHCGDHHHHEEGHWVLGHVPHRRTSLLVGNCHIQRMPGTALRGQRHAHGHGVTPLVDRSRRVEHIIPGIHPAPHHSLIPTHHGSANRTLLQRAFLNPGVEYVQNWCRYGTSMFVTSRSQAPSPAVLAKSCTSRSERPSSLVHKGQSIQNPLPSLNSP